MSSNDEQPPATDQPDVIYAYTAADAVRDGGAVEFNPATALEAGFALPVIMTHAAYEDAIEWTRPEEWLQSMDARFWDVLTMVRLPGKAALESGRAYQFRVARIANKTKSGSLSKSTTAHVTTLIVRAEGFDRSGAPCLMISRPGED
jgi:hypothetical protein